MTIPTIRDRESEAKHSSRLVELGIRAHDKATYLR